MISANSNGNADLDQDVRDVLEIVDSGQNAMNFQDKILTTISSLSKKGSTQVEAGEAKSAIQTLDKLQSVCSKLLSNYTPNPKSEVLTAIRKAVAIYEKYKKDVKSVNLQVDDYLDAVQRHSKDIVLDQSLSDMASFYVTATVSLAEAMNNTGVIYYKNNRLDRATQHFCCAIDLFNTIEHYLSAFQIYSFSLVMVNLCICIEDPSRVEKIGKILCYAIIFLEKLDSELEARSIGAYNSVINCSRFVIIFSRSQSTCSPRVSFYKSVGPPLLHSSDVSYSRSLF